MKQSLKERFAQQGPIRGIDRVPSGSPVNVEMSPARKLGDVRTIDAVHTLVRYGVSARAAKQSVEAIAEKSRSVILVPLCNPQFVEDMLAIGVRVVELPKPALVDPRELRSRLALTAREFAVLYRLSLRTVEGWEQGRPMDDAAMAYLNAISGDPEGVARALAAADGRSSRLNAI